MTTKKRERKNVKEKQRPLPIHSVCLAVKTEHKSKQRTEMTAKLSTRWSERLNVRSPKNS